MFSYMVEILADSVEELVPEMFRVQLSLVDEATSAITLDEQNDIANVTITDISSMSLLLFFMRLIICSSLFFSYNSSEISEVFLC